MRISRATIFSGMVLGLAVIFSVMPSALAQDEDRTTASQVVDRDTLKAFVLSARDHFSSITDFSVLLNLSTILREEGGDWNYKSMYLVILNPDGNIFAHGEDPSQDNTNVIDAVDDNGKEVVKEILAAAEAEDGGYVEYTWDDPSTDQDVNPRVCYAITVSHSLLPGSEFILVGGYHHNVTGTGGDQQELPELPEVSASEVRDRETLKAFVQAAGDWSLRAAQALDYDLNKLEAIFRLEGGHWKHGSTYVFSMAPNGHVIFHGARPDQEGQIRIDLEDGNGFRFVEALVNAALGGGGYVDYYWDDPGVTGDEELGSAKVGYAETVTLPDDFPNFGGLEVVVGSGFYKGNQVSLDFAHFANGGGISSDVVVVNAASKDVQPAIYFYDKQGVLIDPTSVVDVMEQGLEVKSYGALTVPSGIPSLGELTIPTHGTGDLVTGSVKVVSDAPDSPIGGVLRFDLTGVGVAGVGASQAVRDAIFPARRMAGGINTGAAFRNLSESELTLTCHLMKDGQELEETTVTLPANGQDAKFINELFEYDTSAFNGSVRCTAPAGQQEFAAVALEMDTANRIFTTLPVVPVPQAGTASAD